MENFSCNYTYIDKFKYSFICVFVVLVSSYNYASYWIQTPGEKLLKCSETGDSSVICEVDECSLNCRDTFEIESTLIRSNRSNSVTGVFNRENRITWNTGTTWSKKRKF